MAAAALAGANGAQAQEQERATLIHGARVFEGTGKPAKIADVLIEGGKVSRVGRSCACPRGRK